MGSALFPDPDPEKMAREELVASFYRLKAFAERYRRSEEALRLDEARLEALLALNDMAASPEEDIIAYSLEEAIRLTGSKIGWMGALSQDEKMLTMHCWSKGTKEECNILDRPHSICISGGGLWVEPILRGKPVVYNDLSSNKIPYGHIPIKRFMGIPVYDSGRIVAVAEVGNKASPYDRSDMRQLTLLMGSVWRIIMRKRVGKALSESKAQAELYVDFMSHDISNMNQVAMGYLELAMEKLADKGSLDKADMVMLSKPMDTMRNSAKLIDNVKKLQRLRDGMLEPMVLDLGKVLQDMTADAGSIQGRHITIDYYPVHGRSVKANELLPDVFANILGNSIKHSSPDKPLGIVVRLSTSDQWHRVTIEDNGPGIPDDRKGKIFSRLSPGNMKHMGTGLGLGLVKTLVESYNGRIWAEDRVPGDYRQGCRFVVELPEAC
ncbi:putative histidine kinase [Methanocella paludicola SANAE]|uniref:Histidine kinase n=1 Tax=Methanocella paludicola (strain DSM 17711 / JCM 13418 / NBRC 101707 / SANAE) TaxID=304371 RepID=D1YYH6_METPS|nr:GAF domain-containing sensor histidine kinase [Methanocella paludicola]BAI61498.1 putative histidine kinase [Methanocella paludicola SANAE]